MNHKHNNTLTLPLISTQILIPSFVLIFTVFIAWTTFQQSGLFEKKLYNRVLSTVANTGINANAIEIDGRDVIIGLAYIKSPLQLSEINKLLVTLPGIANVYNKKDTNPVAPPPPVKSAPVVPVKPKPLAITTSTTVPPPVTIPIKTVTPTPKAVDNAPKLAVILTQKLAGASIDFNFRTDVLTSKSKQRLKQLVPALLQYKQQKIVVAGHTDNQGQASMNKTLSKQRADKVVDYLVTQGVNRQQLKAIGYGEMKPIASNETETGRKQNRRITFTSGE